jgi:ubiquinone biosynthesis protein COQ4
MDGLVITCPGGTLTRAYITSVLLTHRFVNDPELAYVLRRMREVHDFWHVLFGCHTNVFGELALKAVEFVQARGEAA